MINTGRVLEPAKALAIIDDSVAGKFAAAELTTVHGIPQEWIRTTLGQITRAVGTGAVPGRLQPAAGMPSRGMNTTLTRWPPVSSPGKRHVVCRDRIGDTSRRHRGELPVLAKSYGLRVRVSAQRLI
jgi:hypothetical protein